MLLQDAEALELIRNLLVRYVPNSLDRINALESLDNLSLELTGRSELCPKCHKTRVCPECDDLEIDFDHHASVTIGNRTIYVG